MFSFKYIFECQGLMISDVKLKINEMLKSLER